MSQVAMIDFELPTFDCRIIGLTQNKSKFWMVFSFRQANNFQLFFFELTGTVNSQGHVIQITGGQQGQVQGQAAGSTISVTSPRLPGMGRQPPAYLNR